MLKKLFQSQRGQSLLEVVIALSLLSIVFTGSWQILHDSFMAISQETRQLKAHYLVVGGLEGIRSIRNEDWNAIVDGTWHFEYDDSDPLDIQVVLVDGSESVLDGYSRTIEISSVRRDTMTGKITEDPAWDFDPNTKKITVTVEWYYLESVRSDSETIYLSNWQKT